LCFKLDESGDLFTKLRDLGLLIIGFKNLLSKVSFTVVESFSEFLVLLAEGLDLDSSLCDLVLGLGKVGVELVLVLHMLDVTLLEFDLLILL
jgi:hypothetical protein